MSKLQLPVQLKAHTTGIRTATVVGAACAIVLGIGSRGCCERACATGFQCRIFWRGSRAMDVPGRAYLDIPAPGELERGLHTPHTHTFEKVVANSHGRVPVGNVPWRHGGSSQRV